MDRNVELYINSAKSLGYETEVLPFAPNHCKFSSENYELYLLHTSLSCNNGVSVNLVQNKYVCSKLLRNSGIPGTVGQIFSTEGLIIKNRLKPDLARYVDPLYPIVIKPKSDTLSRNVYIDIRNESDLRSSLKDFLKSNRSRVLIEKFVFGDSYRVLSTSEKIVEVLKYQPGEVTGTGNQTIKQLILGKRFQNDYGKELRIRNIDWSMKHHLEVSKRNLEDILPKGDTISIDDIPRYQTGGNFRIIPIDSIPDDTIDMCINACKTTGLFVAGIDFITPNIHESWRENDCAINELNSAPYMTVHARVHPEDPEFVPRSVLKHIFSNHHLH